MVSSFYSAIKDYDALVNIKLFLDYTTGCTTDYARGCHNIKFAYTIELEKGGKSGFIHSPQKIVEIGTELVTGIAAMVRFVNKYYKTQEKCFKQRYRILLCKHGRRHFFM